MEASMSAALDPLAIAYLDSLAGKAASTMDVYTRALRQFLVWLRERPGSTATFQPATFTRTAVETYLADLEQQHVSVSHRARTKAVLSGFARWLIEDQGLLQRNPTRGVAIPAQALLAPRELSADQRYVLRSLVERAGDPRTAALFALGYWAGCRVSDVSWLEQAHTHLTPPQGWLHVGYKGGKTRDIDLHREAGRALVAYLAEQPADALSPYVFPSQRGTRLTEAGIHHWFRTLKARATHTEWPLIAAVAFHDLRHDFAHRARAAGWSLEAVAYYLGHITNKGTPAIQTTARYTQVSRAQVKAQLGKITG
jgi:site-specific recombinase XerD